MAWTPARSSELIERAETPVPLIEANIVAEVDPEWSRPRA